MTLFNFIIFLVVGQPSAKVAKPKDVTLKMWKSGFSVDDGPFRSFDDPANQEFLTSIKRGYFLFYIYCYIIIYSSVLPPPN